MRLRDLIRGHERDPLLKMGVGAMIVALGFAIVVAFAASIDRPMKVAVAKTEAKSTTEPLVRTDPGVDPWVERDIPPPRPAAPVEPPAPPKPETAPRPEPAPKPEAMPIPEVAPTPKPSQPAGPQPVSAPKPDKQAEPGPNPEVTPEPAPPPEPQSERNQAPRAEAQSQAANHSGRYHLPKGAIMSLSVPSIGLRQVPVLNSDTKDALNRGVVHLPDTSLPWSETPEKNVYLAGHRLGWPGTGSHLVFYRLNELTGGEKITLRGADGRRYDYRVIDDFVVGPHDDWVTGRVRGRNLLTLQTCTPIPTFQWRLIVRAERV